MLLPGALVDCAASPVKAPVCEARWIAEVGPLLPGADAPRAGEMIGYYVGLLRKPGRACA
jgi:hypothetical protein